MKIKWQAIFIILILGGIIMSCHQEETITVDASPQINLKYNKVLRLMDKDGNNSVDISLSSDEKGTVDLYAPSDLTVSPLTKEMFDQKYSLESSDIETEADPGSEVNFSTESNDLHIEILSTKKHSSIYALDIEFPKMEPLAKASGTRWGTHWHYSWSARHTFIITPLNPGSFCAGGQKISNGGCCWPTTNGVTGFKFLTKKCSYRSINKTDWNNNIDTRVLVMIPGGYRYTVL